MEVTNYLTCHHASGVPVTPDVLTWTPQGGVTAIDAAVHNITGEDRTPRAQMAVTQRIKHQGWGRPEQVPELRAAVEAADAAVHATQDGTPEREAADAQRSAAVKERGKAWHPGYAEPARLKGAQFVAFVVASLGGYTDEAARALRELCHPGDQLQVGEEGERFYSPHSTFATRLHRHHLVHTAAVAMWRATYNAAADVARGVPPRPRHARAGAGAHAG